ncbi:MAG: hypothetical protein ACOCUI_00095 [bacterium]
MEENEYIKVKGNIVEVKLQKETGKIYIALDVDGIRKTVEITTDQIIKFDADLETKQSLMLKYYEAWKVRQEKGLPVYLELTQEQMNKRPE